MRHLLPLTAIAFMLSTAPLAAQDATDPALESEIAVEGEFNRQIPEGLKANLTEQEQAEYQAQLEQAETPQERNRIRHELQKLNKERHLEQVQKNKPKGFFESLSADFKSLTNGKANGGKSTASGDRGSKSKSAGNGGGGRSGGNSGGGRSGGGGNGGGNGGGGGGGRSK